MPDSNLLSLKGQTNTDKWKDTKYSRQERQRRKLNNCTLKQQKITDFFSLLNEIEVLIKENKMLKNELHKAFIEKKND